MDTAESTAPDRPPRELYRRLMLVAGLFKDAGPLPEPGRYLLWRDAQGKVRYCLIDRDLVIGRAPDCDVVLDDPRVSRRHALIRHLDHADVIAGTNPTNGLMHNEAIMKQPTILMEGDGIVLGKTLATYLMQP